MPLNPDGSVKLLIDRLTTLSENDSANAERVIALEGELASVRLEAREEIERLLLHTYQVQESLEQVFQDDQAKQKQLEELEKGKKERAAEEKRVTTLESELSEVKREVEEVKKEVEEVKREVEKVKREAEELKLQLNQMEEELEHQFLSNQKQKDMLDTYAIQEDRFQYIIHKILQVPTA